MHWTRRSAVEESSSYSGASDDGDAAGAGRGADVRGGAGAVDVGGVHVEVVEGGGGGSGGCFAVFFHVERERER